MFNVFSARLLPFPNFDYSTAKTVLSNDLAVPRSSVDEPVALKRTPPDTFVKARKPSPEEEEEGDEPVAVPKKADDNMPLKIVVGIAAVALVSLVVAWLIQHHRETTPPHLSETPPPSKPKGSKPPSNPPEPPKPKPTSIPPKKPLNPSNPSSNHGSGARPTGSSPTVDFQEEIEKLRRANEKRHKELRQEMQERRNKAREEFEQQQKKWQNGSNYSSPFTPDFDDPWGGYDRDPNWTPFGTYKSSSPPSPNSFEDLFNNGFWDDILNGSWSGSHTGGSTRKPPNNSHQPKSPDRGANQSNSTNSFNSDGFNANHHKDGAKGSSGAGNTYADSGVARSKYPENFDWLLKEIGLSQQQYENLSLEDLKKAKRKLFQKLHPDANINKSVEEQQRIEESFKRANNVLEWMEKDKGG